MEQDAGGELSILWKGGQSGFVGGGDRVNSTLSGGAHALVVQARGELRFGTLASYEGHPHIRTSWGYPLEPGVPSVYFMRMIGDYIRDYDGGEWFLAAGLPNEAVRGELVVTMGNGMTCASPGEREMDVIWFPITLDPDEHELYVYPYLKETLYELKLYDAQGALVSQTSGAVYKEATHT